MLGSGRARSLSAGRCGTCDCPKSMSATRRPPTSPALKPPYAITRISSRSLADAAASTSASTSLVVSGRSSGPDLSGLRTSVRPSGFDSLNPRLTARRNTAESISATFPSAPGLSVGSEAHQRSITSGVMYRTSARPTSVPSIHKRDDPSAQGACCVRQVLVRLDHRLGVLLDRVRRVLGLLPPGRRSEVALFVDAHVGPWQSDFLDRLLEPDSVILVAELLRPALAAIAPPDSQPFLPVLDPRQRTPPLEGLFLRQEIGLCPPAAHREGGCARLAELSCGYRGPGWTMCEPASAP